MKQILSILISVIVYSCNQSSKEDNLKYLFIDKVEDFKHDMRIVNVDFYGPIKTNRIGNLLYDTTDIFILGCFHILNKDTFWIYTKVNRNHNENDIDIPIFTSSNIDLLRQKK